MRRSISDLMAEYGPVAVWVYLTIFVLVFAASWAGIQLGWRPESVSGSMGTLGAAWVATKLTQPLRIAATLALTPLAARLSRRTGRGASVPAAKTAPER